MAKKSVRRHARHAVRRTLKVKDYVVIVRSWMFVVAFALMLGLGAILGTFFRQQLEASAPVVAGVSTEAR